MKRTKPTVLFAAAVVVSCLPTFSNDPPRWRVRSANEAELTSAVPTLDIEHQRKCTEQARAQFRHLGLARNPLAHFSDRYNERMKKCFIEIDVVTVGGNGGTDDFRSLGDARGREYADYVQSRANGSDPSQHSAAICEIDLGSGERMKCHSLHEFEQVVKDYMR